MRKFCYSSAVAAFLVLFLCAFAVSDACSRSRSRSLSTISSRPQVLNAQLVTLPQPRSTINVQIQRNVVAPPVVALPPPVVIPPPRVEAVQVPVTAVLAVQQQHKGLLQRIFGHLRASERHTVRSTFRD